mgnify:CR=1 FL=1
MNKTIKLSYLIFALSAYIFASCSKTEPTSISDSSILFNPALTYDTLTDINGNTYHTIKIGTQTWMASNLRVTKYLNGDLIGTTSNATKDISSEDSPKYQWAYNGEENNVAKYGRLYTWYAITDIRKIAPLGWHIASDAEWDILEAYVSVSPGTSPNIAKALAGSTDWATDTMKVSIGNDLTLNNSSGFSALPGGRRYSTGTFNGIGKFGYFWNSRQYDASTAFYKIMGYSNNEMVKSNFSKQYGYSVRCVKDN